MNIKTKFVCFLCLILQINTGSSQEASGLIFGQFNGVNATKINPAFAFNSTNKWDIQLAGAQLFFQTDYGYINKSNLFKTLSNIDNIKILNYPDDALGIAGQNTAIFKVDNTDSYAHGRTEVFGPGFMFNINPNIKLGLFTRGRAFASAAEIPDVLNYYTLYNSIIDRQYDSKSFQGAVAGWNEVGIIYAQKIDEKISVGFSFKYNVGVGASHYSVENNFSFVSRDVETISSLSEGQFTIGHTGIEDDGMIGKGFGLDLGITWNDFLGLGSRLGISLLDIGYTKLPGRTIQYGYNNSTTLFRENYEIISTPDALIEQMDIDFNPLDRNEKVVIDHPTMISLQYSHPITEKINVEAALNQRIKVSNSQILKSNSFLVAGVYDTKNFSAFLPITLYNYQHINPGLAFRIYFLTIGSDDLSSLVGKQNFNGTDFYINLNLYPFLKKKKDKDEVPCFDF